MENLSKIRQIIREEINYIFEKDSSGEIFYHGTSSIIPFQNFDKSSEGNGIVSSGGRKYGGFFFTSDFDNAEYYSEYFVAEVKITTINEDPLNNTHPPTVMNRAIEDNKIYIVRDVLDGAVYSDIVVVPHSQINNVKILNWKFVGDKDFYFESLDEFFGGKMDLNDEESFDDNGNLMEPYVDKDIISSFFEITGGDLNYLLSIPIFKEYYDSR